MQQSRNHTRGFTLIEVVLTVLIMSMLLVSITKVLTAARTSRDTIHNIQETQQAGPAIMDMIERDLRGIWTTNIPPQSHIRIKNRVELGLDSDGIDFISSTNGKQVFYENDRAIRADINEVGYRLRPSKENDDFLEIYRREGFGVDEEPFDGGNYIFLHDRVKSFDIQIFEEDGPDAEPIEEWNYGGEDEEQWGLPARIEITLTLELAPRIMREQLAIAPVDRRTMVYRRVIRLPEESRLSAENIPRIGIPGPPGSGPTSGEEDERATTPTGGGGDPRAEGRLEGGEKPRGDGRDGSGSGAARTTETVVVSGG